MGINVTIDEKLIEQASRLVGKADRVKLVEQALSEMIRNRGKMKALLDIAGTIEFREGYDDKALRKIDDDAA